MAADGRLPSERRVLVVFDYVPEYRRRFYERLEEALRPESIRLEVAVGTATPGLSARGDTVSKTEMPFVKGVPSSSVYVAGRRLTYKKLSDMAAGSDLVIVEQAIRHLENYVLLSRRRHGPKVALWGHGVRGVKPATRLERLVERRLTKAAHWFFAYTQSGADHVVSYGFPRDRVTIVQNTIDVSELGEHRDRTPKADVEELRASLRIPERRVCLYVGGLDAPKRLGFLLEASSLVAQRVPDFTLVVAGDGDERHVIERALPTSPWLRYVGRATGRDKARLGALSELMLMPGAVGLVAVDSFALKTPIVTTDWPFHGPEVKYLEDGRNALFSRDDVAEYARMVEDALRDHELISRLKAGCAMSATRYTLDAMVANFAGGVNGALDAPRRTRTRHR
jgi:glycosyltransferase involved in cell wall biosynthesis